MMRLVKAFGCVLTALAVALALSIASEPIAIADGGAECPDLIDVNNIDPCSVWDGNDPDKNDDPDGSDDSTGNGTGSKNGGSPKEIDNPNPGGPTAEEIWQDKVDEINDQNQAEIDRYKGEIDRWWNECMANVSEQCEKPAPPNLQDPPDRPEAPEGEDPGPRPPVFTPPEAAWIVISTQLNIHPVQPGIGPDPDRSKWDMAVVGYPYWLWADGETQASAEASAGGLHVSLNAHVSGLVFDMGDGNKVQCKGTGTRLSGTGSMGEPSESPTCGYRWGKVSGKKKEYTVTVTAYWQVDWVAGGATGTEYLATTATRQVPVGELQTVVDG